MLNGLIRNNPADPCVLPRRPKQKVKPLNEEQITKLIKALKGHKYENLILTTLFTGLREGEICGLQWDCVNLEAGTILVDKQLQSLRKNCPGQPGQVCSGSHQERQGTVSDHCSLCGGASQKREGKAGC